jgi:hypothetical protein
MPTILGLGKRKDATVSRRHLLSGVAAATAGAVAPLPFDLLAKTPAPDPVILPIRMLLDRLFTTIEAEAGRSDIAVLDTGAVYSTMSRARARELKLRLRDKSEINGFGGDETVGWVKLENPLLGGMHRIPEMWLLTSDLLDNTGFKMTIGSEWFAQRSNVLDLAAAQWLHFEEAVFDPVGFTQVADSFKMINYQNHFEVDAIANNFAGRFHIDTGSPAMMILDRRATRAMGLWETQQPYAPVRLGGYGKGMVDARLYRLQTLSIHGFEIDKPLALLCDPRATNPQFIDFDGLIGMGAIRNFNIFFDTKAKSVWLKPHGIPFESNPKYVLSGLSIDSANGVLMVADVGIGSPAHTAGLAKGDVIIGLEREELRLMLNGIAGSIARFTYERGGTQREVQLTLQPYL